MVSMKRGYRLSAPIAYYRYKNDTANFNAATELAENTPGILQNTWNGLKNLKTNYNQVADNVGSKIGKGIEKIAPNQNIAVAGNKLANNTTDKAKKYRRLTGDIAIGTGVLGTGIGVNMLTSKKQTPQINPVNYPMYPPQYN